MYNIRILVIAGKRPRQVEASGCCGNGPEWPVNA
jgi:hypothetical protein